MGWNPLAIDIVQWVVCFKHKTIGCYLIAICILQLFFNLVLLLTNRGISDHFDPNASDWK